MNCTELTQKMIVLSGLVEEFGQKYNKRENLGRSFELKSDIERVLLEVISEVLLNDGPREEKLIEQIQERGNYQYVGSFYCLRSSVKFNGKQYFVDPLGRRIKNFAKDGFDQTEFFTDNRACVQIDGIWYYINLDGEKINNFAKDGFEDVQFYCNNRARVKKGGIWYIIDPIGQKIENFAADGFADNNIHNFALNRFLVKRYEGWYLIDLDGNKIIKSNLGQLLSFSINPTATVDAKFIKDGKQYTIDQDGKIVG